MLLTDLLDLVLPATCAGCDEPATGPLCGPCRAALAAVRPGRTRPVPAPPGLPPVFALAAYAGSLRRMLIQYKERNRHELTPVLGGLLAKVVAAATPDLRGSLTLVPVPATTAAARRRYGDHIDRIAQHAAGALRRRGVQAGVAGLLRALPKREDSAELSAAERARAAGQAFAVRGRRVPVGTVVLVDDIITTGSTLAASTARLAAAGVRVDRVAVLAATQRQA
ncbi:phosphoribosyltransferase family protein [Dactylosporangium sp. NBC_01737]|uniref:ComF family protein n=1 Tax=Dactylosporangium sp. NBC_01737 TaxID=2975959 RepID=UPI002E144552|nr:phosphoribosyltransferase family protein [Dactylosporangium sp. NBC_01737]